MKGWFERLKAKIGKILDHPVIYALLAIYLVWVGIGLLNAPGNRLNNILGAINMFLWAIINGLKIFKWVLDRQIAKASSAQNTSPQVDA